MDYLQNIKRIGYTVILASSMYGCGFSCEYKNNTQTKPSVGVKDISDKVSTQRMLPERKRISCSEEDIERSTRSLCKNADPESEFYEKLNCARFEIE